jgi:chromate transporter
VSAKKRKLLLTIFTVFLKISPVTFGGGYAMLSLIEMEVVTKYKWVKRKDIVDIFTVAQSVPGAVAINSAILVGYRVAGGAGAVVAMLGILIPALIIVMVMSFSYFYFYNNPIVGAAFEGIGAAVIALIVYAAYIVGKKAITDITTLIIAVVSFISLMLFPINPILTIVFGLASGVIICKWKLRFISSEEGEDVHDFKEEKKSFL